MSTKKTAKRLIPQQPKSCVKSTVKIFTELVSAQEAQAVYGIEKVCHKFQLHCTSIRLSAEWLDQCYFPSRSIHDVLYPLFNMTGVIQVIGNGYVLNKNENAPAHLRFKSRKNVYQVVFCRLATPYNPDNSIFANTLAIENGVNFGYRTMREAIDVARQDMFKHYAAVHGNRVNRYTSFYALESVILKPYVKPVAAEIARV